MLVRMTTTTASPRRLALFDRIVRWALDTDGDLYGDERERLRWYEGIATAAGIQWLLLPWSAVVLVWVLGLPAVLPTAVLLAGLYLPMMMCTLYVRRRRVDTTVHRWTAKRMILNLLGGLPFPLFLLGCLRAWPTDRDAMPGALIGAALGGLIAGGGAAYVARRRRRAAATAGHDD